MLDIHQLIEDLRGAVTRGDAEIHTIIEQHLPALAVIAEQGARLADSGMAHAVETVLGLPASTQAVIAEAMTKIAAEIQSLVPAPVPAPVPAEPQAPAEEPAQA